MKIVCLTGGIASGKTTIVNFLKKKNLAVHDSDFVVSATYAKPKTKFITYLKKINLGGSLKKEKIDKKIIREEIFNNTRKKMLLEKYLHAEVKKARNLFLKQHTQKKTKIVFLDIPLLFESKLEKLCDYCVLLYAPLKLRRQRAIKRRGMNKKILDKIIKNQQTDRIKREKSDFVINTSRGIKKSFNDILEIIDIIKEK